MLGAALPPRPPGGAPPKELPPAGQRRLPDGRRPDHLWSVLHRREESHGPRHRAESREEGGRRESRSLPSRPEMEMEPMQYPGQLPPLGWAPSPMPAMAMPNLAPENDWRDFKANLRPRMVVDGGAEAKEWLERRLESALTEQRAELTRRFAGFEHSDKHFKDWVQREHEQLHSQLQQLRVSLQETGSQQQRLVGNLTAQGQKQDMRLQELEGQMAQAAAQLQGLMNAVSAGALQGAGGNGGGTGEAAMGAAAVAASASANLEVLRAGLEREAQQRVQLGAETAEQLKQLSDMVYELNSRQQQQQSSQQQQLQQNAVQEEKDLVRSEARFAALEPSVLQLREELEEMRKMLYKCGADCAKRCDENEEICNKRLGGVQEAALSAARELWEEHQGVVVECKSSLSALQQILDSKDKIALQLRSLQQQQREEDKQEFWSQMQLRHEQLQAKLADTERALQTEQNTRIEEQQRYETVLSRLGLALEKAQAAWLRDSAKLSQEIHEAKRDFSIEMDGETRGVARRLADGLEAQQKLADELERKLALAKTELGSVLERLDSTARAQQQELRDAEGRLMRQVNDVQTIQGGRTQQAVFDMKAELAKQEQVSAARLSALQKGQDELEGRAMMALNNLETRSLQKIQDSADLEREKTRNEMTRALEEERTERLRMDEELREEHLRHLAEMREQVDDNKKELNEIVQNAEERLVKRLEDQVTVERTKTREQIEAFIEEERSERLKAEAERLTSLQKRLQAHEELTLQRLSEQRARWETEVETLRQKLEAQALKDKQDLNKDLQDFVQEERQVTSGLADDMRVLGGECQSLAESFQKHQSATEQRLAHEAAALSAQLSVGNASLTALLAQHGQTQQLALETRAREITGEIVKVSDELDKMNGEILKLIDDESDKVKEKHLAMESRVGTLEMAFTARTAALGEQDQVLQERMEELARQNGEAIENMRETLTSETGKLLEHMGRVQDDVKSVEAEALRRCEDMAEAQSEAKMEMDNMFGTFQANLGELGAKIEDVAISQSKIHTELKEQLQKLTESQEKETSRATETEKQLTAQLATQNGEHLALAEKHKDLAEDVDRRFAELKAVSEAEKATMASQHAEEQKAAEEAMAEMSKSAEASQASMQEMLAEMTKNTEAKLQEEKSRAMEAESALREGLAAQASQAAAQAAAQAQAQAAQADEAVRQTREAEDLRKQIAEHTEKLEAVQGSCHEAKQAAEKYKEETTKAIESVRDDALGAVASESKEAVAALETKFGEATRAQNEMKDKLEQLQKSDEDFMQALSSEEQRARRAEEALQEQLAEAQKVSSSLAEKVEETQKHAEKAEAEAKVAQESVAEAKAKSEAESKAADQTLEEELAKLKKESAEESKVQLEKLQSLEQQIKQLEEAEKKAEAVAMDKDAGVRKEQEQHKADLEDLKKRLKEAETQDAELKRESSELRDLQGKQQEEQSKATQEVQQRQEAAGEELKSLQKKLEELSSMKDAAAKSEELVQSCQTKVTILQEKLDQEVGTVKLRMEGGFKALLQRLEAEKWLRENVDTVADGVSNSFLRLLDKSSDKLKERVDKLEGVE